MTDNLSIIDKSLCNALQCGIEATARPFAIVADSLGITEQEVIDRTIALKEMGIIKRIAANVNYHALGKISVLVSAHVPAQEISSIAAKVSNLPGVSHNYLRNHHYNLWFTLQADSDLAITSELSQLAAHTGMEFHPLAATRIFKLDVRFDTFSEGRALLPPDSRPRQFDTRISVSPAEISLMQALQKGIEIIPQPFVALGTGGKELKVLATIQRLLDTGVIRRIGTVVNYRKLGFVANAMLVCEVKEDRIEAIGTELAKENFVSHCYQRNTFAGWQYNLFAMLHGPDMESLHARASAFAAAHAISHFELLTTERELKKAPVIVSL